MLTVHLDIFDEGNGSVSLLLCIVAARATNDSRLINDGGFDPMRRLTDSLLVIMVVYILGWLMTMTVLVLVRNF